MWGWYAKKYANKVGMMNESEGQHIGKAPSLHLFHTTFFWWEMSMRSSYAFFG